jgi:hypothetical protein
MREMRKLHFTEERNGLGVQFRIQRDKVVLDILFGFKI